MTEIQLQISPLPTVLATLGTIFLSIQLVPQIFYNWRRGSTEGLPALMMFLWALCAVPMGAYFITQKANISLQIQPQIFASLNLICFGQILFYSYAFTWAKATLGALSCFVAFGTGEFLLVLGCQNPYERGTTWPLLMLGIFSAVLIAAGLVMPYLEIWRRGGRVIGISWIFLGIDVLGGVCSLLALAVQGNFDVLGGVMYVIVIVLEAGICLSHTIWRIRQRGTGWSTKNAPQNLSGVMAATGKEEWPTHFELPEGNNKYSEV